MRGRAAGSAINLDRPVRMMTSELLPEGGGTVGDVEIGSRVFEGCAIAESLEPAPCFVLARTVDHVRVWLGQNFKQVRTM